MIGPNFIDEIDCGNFFDHIDDLLDFPTDDVDASAAASFLPPATANCDSFPSMWSTHHDPESFPCSDSVFSSKSASDLSAELSVPYEDIVQLEWLSNFVEDSFSGGSLTINNKDQLSTMNKDSSLQQFQTSSPVSVLESSSSCSGGEKTTAPLSPEALGPSRCGRARSKRPRPATFNPRPAIQLISPTSSVAETPHPFVTPRDENFAESRPLVKMAKKKKARVAIPLAPKENNQNTTQPQAVRKCMHCEITKTPQWRAGPMGPKTLCNACGVRYKSGRLFPEYRPAASPTFVPSIHSNSHKKVVEMRNKFGEKVDSADTASAEMELIPNSNVQQLQLEYI